MMIESGTRSGFRTIPNPHGIPSLSGTGSTGYQPVPLGYWPGGMGVELLQTSDGSAANAPFHSAGPVAQR
ncbi:MAG TPA: hypothetical protein VNT99_07695, partial [Methylomirabilota bacterium]|nr:hypothetical protein [Methylomirabilota bacterium]